MMMKPKNKDIAIGELGVIELKNENGLNKLIDFLTIIWKRTKSFGEELAKYNDFDYFY